MNRIGLLIALAIAVVVGVVLGVYPEFDLLLARPFFETKRFDLNFGMRVDPTVLMLRDISMWLVAALVAPAVAAIVLKFVMPGRRMLVSGRAIVFLIWTMALAPGLLVNLTLKEHWGRSRPIDVMQFGGSEHFVPWWDPRGDCPANCSFVSGDVSGGFWTLAPAALAPPAWRALAYGGALALGSAIALMRMAAGGHFASDVVFAGVFTFLVIWIVHGLIYRWPRTRLSDEDIERPIEQSALWLQDAVLGLFGRRSKRSDP